MQLVYTVQDDASHPRAGEDKKDTLIQLRRVQFNLRNRSFPELFKFKMNTAERPGYLMLLD